MKKIFVFLTALSIVFSGTSLAAEKVPAGQVPSERAEKSPERSLRVLMVPLIDRTGGWITKEAAEIVFDRMDKEFHVPLNDTMRWIEMMPESESESALSSAVEAGASKRVDYSAALRDAALSSGADIAAAVVVTDFWQTQYMNLRGELVIESHAALTLYAYDAGTDSSIKKRASRFEFEEYMPAYEASELLAEALDEALREADLRSLIFPIGERGGKKQDTP